MITIFTGIRIMQGTVLEYTGTSHDQCPANPGLNVHNTMEDL